MKHDTIRRDFLKMEVPTSPMIAELFARYEILSQRSEYRSIARLYCSKLIVADPNGVSVHSNNLITRWQFEKRMKEFYESAGMTSIRIRGLSETRISERYSLVNVSWEATFKKTQSQQFEFHVSYIVRKRKSKAHIVMLIAHEDEKKVLQGYGIIN